MVTGIPLRFCRISMPASLVPGIRAADELIEKVLQFMTE